VSAWTLAIVMAIVIVFGQACSFDFVRWDDDINVYGNPLFQPVSWHHLLRFWRQPYQQLYIPLSYTVYALLALMARSGIDYSLALGGPCPLNPHVFHAANILLHLGNVLLVFGILRLLTRNVTASAVGAMLFGLHPLQVEAVCWISEMRGLLGNFLSLISLYLYVCYAIADRDGQHGRRNMAMSAFAVLILALLCKPTAVVMPLIAGATDICLIRRPVRRSLLECGIAFAVAAVWIPITQSAQPVPTYLKTPFAARPSIAVDAISFYLVKLVAPFNLGIDYGRSPAFVLGHPAWWAWPIVIACAGGLAWAVRARRWTVVASAAVFVISLLPVLGLVPFVFQRFSTVADRYAYMGLLGPAILLAFAINRWPGQRGVAVSAAAIVLLSIVSVRQVGVWRDSATLFDHAIAVNPRSSFSLGNLGSILFERQDYANAIRCYEQALTVVPKDEKLHLNMALAYYGEGRVDDAIDYFRKTIAIDPNNAQAHNDLGVALARSGRNSEAVEEWEAALRLNPGYSEARLNLDRAVRS
jgi:hypothetical protein